MKIVIAGAGAVGFHLATLLCNENQDITLIDKNEDVLNLVSRHLDMLSINGDASNINVLKEAEVKNAKLFISVTTSEKTNLLAAILAKQLGATKTFARISDPHYLDEENRNRIKELGVDVLISPDTLAALEVKRHLKRASFTDLYDFENGKISIVGFTLDSASPLINYSFEKINELTEAFPFRGIALLRNHQTIIPHKGTVLKEGDHLYIASKKKSLEKALAFMGKQLKPIKNVMIVGGTALALRTAQEIENDYSLTVVIEDEQKAKKFAEILNNSLIINTYPGDIESLKEEGLEHMDAFIALSPNSETNIITSLMAEELGVYKTIASVENVNYVPISQNIGVDTIINKKLISANNIFRFVRKGKVEAIVTLHGVDAEIIEFELIKNNRILNHPIKDLHFPEKSIIAGIIRGEQSFTPNEDTFFLQNDKVIILALPEAIHKVEEIFK